MNDYNPLMQYLKPFISQQQANEQPQQQNASLQSNNYSGIKVYEIMKKDDLKYIKPDSTGQKQIIFCEPENEMYIARYNYATEKPDYEKYISEGNIELFKKNDTNAEMCQIVDALVAVANKLESMGNEIQDIKNTKSLDVVTDKLETMHGEIQGLKDIKSKTNESNPKTEKPKRRANGQFKKKGED